MMHRTRITFSLATMLFVAVPQTPAGINLLVGTVDKWMETLLNQLKVVDTSLANQELQVLDGFTQRANSKPILEILYAWSAYDQFEASKVVLSDPSVAYAPLPPITPSIGATSYADVTDAVQSSFKKGPQKGLYIPKTLVKKLLIAADGSFGETGLNQTFNKTADPSIAKIVSSDSSATKELNTTTKTTGIVYRDADGVHFRRFEGWQNIALPMVSSYKLCSLSGVAGKRCGGAYLYGHQLEETSRGLITATIRGAAPFHFLAVDRFGWHHTDYDKDKGFCPGVLMPLSAAGPDFYLIANNNDQANWFTDPQDCTMFRMRWTPEGALISGRGNAFPLWQGVTLTGGSVQRYRFNNPFYTYFDENGAKKSLDLSLANIDPSINKNKQYGFAGTDTTGLDVWFAFDKTPEGIIYSYGTGKPQNEDDFSKTAIATQLYQKNVVTSPYLRNFGFSTEGNALYISNIESRPLNPAAKFCSPAFMRKKFLFWRPEWKAPTPDMFSLTFKARGNSINIALGTKEYAQRVPAPTTTGAFDCSYAYALSASAGSITITKGDGTPLTTTVTGAVAQDCEIYNDYWLSFANGVIKFGSGTVVDQNVIAQATDSAPAAGTVSYSFSSDIRTTDYIGIKSAPYAIITSANATATTNGTSSYTNWSAAQALNARGRGAFTFSYSNSKADDQNALLMIGLNNTLPAAPAAGTNATPITPAYEIWIGTQNGFGHEIHRASNVVNNATSSAEQLIINDAKWHDFWLLFDNGSIAYGSGNQIGQNVLAAWSDTSPTAITNAINYFCFTSTSPSVRFRYNGPQPINSQLSYAAAAGAVASWQPLWQFATPNQGAVTFTATGTATSTAHIGFLPADRPLVSPLYKVVINDADGTAYIAKEGVKQLASVTPLTDEQKPKAAGTTYWVALANGTFLLGTGTNPLDTTSLILKWQDSAIDKINTPLVTRFTLAALNGAITYSNIALPAFTQFAAAFNATQAALDAQAAIRTSWISDQTQVSLSTATANQLFWSPKAQFDLPGSTSFSCAIQKQAPAPFTFLVGFTDALPGQNINSAPQPSVAALSDAKYILAISDTGSVQLRTGTNALLAQTAAPVAALTNLADNKQHTLWVTVSTQSASKPTFTLGLDSLPGSNPLYSYTLTDGQKPSAPLTLNYVGLGGASAAAITAIKTSTFADATSCAAMGTGLFSWQNLWSFGQADAEQITFKATPQATAGQAQPVLAIGLTTTDASNAATQSGQYNNATYVIVIDYTQQVYLLKAPALNSRLNTIHYPDHAADGSVIPTPSAARNITLTSTNPVDFTLSYDNGRMKLSSGNEVLWSYVDQAPTREITRFAFTSLQTPIKIQNITTLGGQSLKTIDQIFSDLTSVLIAAPASIIGKLNDALSQRLHIANLEYFMTNVVDVLAANSELFTDAERSQLVTILSPVGYEPSLANDPTRAPSGVTKAQAFAAALSVLSASSLDWPAIIANYTQQINSIFNPTNSTDLTAAKPLAATHPRRLLFMRKLALLGSLPTATLNVAGVLKNMQELVKNMPTESSVLTSDEQKTVAALNTIAGINAILANIQDSTAMVTLLKQLAVQPLQGTRNAQINAIQNLLSAQRNAPTQVIIKNEQYQDILNLLYVISNNRDELDTNGQKALVTTLSIAKAMTKLSNATTQISGDAAAGLNPLLPSTGQGLDAIMALATTAVDPQIMLTKLKGLTSTVIPLLSTDPQRQAYFQYLKNLITGPRIPLPAAALKDFNDTVVTPLNAVQLSAEETAVVAQAATFINNATTTNNLFVTQLNAAQSNTALLSDYVSLLSSMLKGKGVSTQFAAADYDTFVAQLEYVVDSRELLQAQPKADGTIASSDSQIAAKNIQALTDLIRLTQITPEFASHKADLDALLTQATSDYQFADRIAYGKVEIANLLKRRQTAKPTGVDYFAQRLLSKLQIITNAPGTKTADNFNDLEASIINPLISLTTDADQLKILNALHDQIIASKQSIIQQQTTFIYHYNAAIAQKNNQSLYLSMLLNIITNYRKGLITFDQTTSAKHPTDDATLFCDALTDIVAQRDTLTTADITTLSTTINYAMYADVYTGNATLQAKLQALNAQASTPIPFADRVTKYAAQITAILKLLPDAPARIAFFAALRSLLDAPGDQTKGAVETLANTILTPLTASPLADDEKSVSSALQQFVVNAQQSIKSAAYQLQQLNAVSDFALLISSLKDMLDGKGISVLFSQNDFAQFLSQLKYLVDNRELLQLDATNGQINALQDLLRTAQLTPEFGANKDDLAALLLLVPTSTLFADRVAYLKQEVAALVQQQATASAGTTPSAAVLLKYDRIIKKLTIITQAPGLASDALFNDLDSLVVTPLLKLLANDQPRTAQLQSIRTTLTASKASILTQQATFKYHYQTAQAYATNISQYLGRIKAIIDGERTGVITFDLQSSPSDASTFVNALTAIASRRDLLKQSDLTVLTDTISFALFSKTFQNLLDLKESLTKLAVLAATPIVFADRVATYAPQTATVINLKQDDPQRVAFFMGLQALIDAPGLITSDILTVLQEAILTPLNASPLSSSERVTTAALQQFFTNAQAQAKSATYQLTQLQQTNDWSTYINTLQAILNAKGINVIFGTKDYDLFMSCLSLLIDNRELLQASANGALIKNLLALLKSTQLNADFAAYRATLDQLITDAGTDHTFVDRIKIAQSDVATITALKQARPTAPLLPVLYDRLIAKLMIILTASGSMTADSFDLLDTAVITPLLALVDTDARRQQIQATRAKINDNKSSLIQKQATFAYRFAAARAQATNPSMYVGMLKDIINSQRQQLITFSSSTTPSDAQVFLNALADAVSNRDNLSSNDLTVLASAINFALYSDLYVSNAQWTAALKQLSATVAIQIPFADRVKKYSASAKAVITLASTDPVRIAYFNCLQALTSAPGLQPNDALTLLQDSIITPFSASPLSDAEKATITSLQNFLTATQNNAKNAGYQITVLQATEADMNRYITALQDLLTRKNTYFTFTPNDLKAFADQVAYVVNSRELLNATGLAAAQQLVSATALSPDFAPFSTQLTTLASQVTQPYSFIDRVTWLITEVQQLVNRAPAPEDPGLNRFITKLTLLTNADQTNATDQQFNDLETKVIAPLSSLTLSDEQKTRIQTVRAQLSAQKAVALQNAATFQYQFTLAQAQVTNLPQGQAPSFDGYLDALQALLVKQRNNTLTFTAGDSAKLLSAVQDLVANRDSLTAGQITKLKTLVSYCSYSTLYKGADDAAALVSLFQQIDQPLPLAQLVPKYVASLQNIVFLSSDDPQRALFFTQLANIPKSTENIAPALIDQINTTLLARLNGLSLSFTEQAVLKTVQAFMAAAEQKSQSVSYLLQIADVTSATLFEYAQMTMNVAQQKGSTLTFSSDDDLKVLGALAYITASRELLSADQVKSVIQAINSIIWLGTFETNKASLQTLLADLATVHTFSDRIAYISQELKTMLVNKAAPTSMRMARLVDKLKTILSATGTSTPADFDTLQNTLTQLQRMALPAPQQQIVANTLAQVLAQKDTILAAQKTFKYNFDQAQLIQDNLTNYLSALQNIIVLKRQNQINFEAADYPTFLRALTVVSDQQDMMSASDLASLKNTINYTYYSAGFTDNAQYKQTLANLTATLNTVVTFAQRVDQYAASVDSILQLDNTNITRQRFFNKLGQLPNLSGSGNINDVQRFVTTVMNKLAPANATEQKIVEALNAFIVNVQQQAASLSYNIKILTDQVTAASVDGSQNIVDIMINGLNDIIVRTNAGTIQLTGNDPQLIVSLASNLVDNRELFSVDQLGKVQSMIRAIQFGAGFSAYKAQLDQLYTTASTPQTFAERIVKYRSGLPQMNSTPTTDPSKNQFVTMVTTIFSAPGDQTLELLNSLQTEVVNPIRFGNFTDEQKQRVSALLVQIAATQTKLNSFAYRFAQAQTATTPSDYYRSLTQLINDFAAGTVALSNSDFSVLLDELEVQVALRPLSVNTQSEIYSLVQLVKAAPLFSTRSELQTRLTQLSTTVALPVDPLVRISYFAQTTMAMLGKALPNGARSQFFARLSQFDTELNSLPATTLGLATVRTGLENLATALNQFSLSSSATVAEKEIMTNAARQLQDITLTGGGVTATPTPAATTSTAATAAAAGVVLTPVAPVANVPKISSRFYRAMPSSRYAQ